MSGFYSSPAPIASAGVAGLIPSTGVTSALIVDGAIVNVDVGAAAAIAAAKLAAGVPLTFTNTVRLSQGGTTAYTSPAVGGGLGTLVGMVATLQAGAAARAEVLGYLETGVGTGVFTILVMQATQEATDVLPHQWFFTIWVPTGRRWQASIVSAGGTTQGLTELWNQVL